MPTTAIRMKDGHVVHSCGACEVDVSIESKIIAHQVYVMDTKAFHFVLGTDFFVEHSDILPLRLQAPYVLQVDHGDGGESVSVEQSEHTPSYLKVCKREPSAMMVACGKLSAPCGCPGPRSKGVRILQGRPERGVVRQ